MKLARALLVLGRVSNLPSIWSNCLCGWLIGVGYAGLDTIVDWTMLLCLCIGATAIYLGGMYLNDACDVAFDRNFRKERPIPSGAISESAVWKIGIGLLAAGVGLLSLQGGTTALLTLALFNCVLVYNFLHKKIKWSPVLIATCRFLLILVGASFAYVTTNPEDSFFAHQNSGLATWTALVLGSYIVGLSWLAKVESEPGVVRYWPCLLLFLPMLLAFLVNPGGADRKDAMYVSAILGLWIIRCMRYTFWGEKRDIGKTVGGLLAGISLVDLLAVPLVNTELAAIFLGCFLLSLLTQRWVPAT
tara:strand:- start:62 stop:970 length:909 start_codon:yes stop_codon:yes gene_type:complete